MQRRLCLLHALTLATAFATVLGWDRKADQYPEGFVENLKDVIAGQAAILALRSLDGS